MGRLKIWNSAESTWQYVDSISVVTSASYSTTSSYALNAGGNSETASYAVTASTATSFTAASASLITGSLYIQSNSGSFWQLSIFEDGNNVGTVLLTGPYAF